MSDIRDHEELMKKVFKITKRCARDLNEELAKSNPTMSVALTAKQTCISLLVIDMVLDCMRAMPGDFDEVTKTVMNILQKGIKHYKEGLDTGADLFSNKTKH